MSTRQNTAPSAPIASKRDLIEAISKGEKPADQWRIGTEHEKFIFDAKTLAPIPYGGPRGIRAILDGMVKRSGWEPILEGANVIALKRPDGEKDNPLTGTISLEPAGQFELSGAPLVTLHGVADETAAHLADVRAIIEPMGLAMAGLGHTPTWRHADLDTMPKPRYGIMKAHMPKVGSRGLDMMFRTCTIQVNLDFSSEADMVQKLRVGLALQPIATALFASSPFVEGKPSGFKSTRSEIWRHTDKSRTGMLPFAFEAGMGYERYVDYALDVPMYFVYRDGKYIDVSGSSFRDFMAGKLAALPGVLPTLDDWTDHLTTLFPEARVKKFIEMRGADCGVEPFITALPAFWVGLLYDQAALDAAFDLVKSWTAVERDTLRAQAPAEGLQTPFRKLTVRDLAREALDIAELGLVRRAKALPVLAGEGDETRHLHVLREIVQSGRAVADVLLDAYKGEWNGDASRAFLVQKL
jgi:glutamate--cysteine ligase